MRGTVETTLQDSTSIMISVLHVMAEEQMRMVNPVLSVRAQDRSGGGSKLWWWRQEYIWAEVNTITTSAEANTTGKSKKPLIDGGLPEEDLSPSGLKSLRKDLA